MTMLTDRKRCIDCALLDSCMPLEKEIVSFKGLSFRCPVVHMKSVKKVSP